MKNFGKLAILGAVLAASASSAFATTFSVSGTVWSLPAFQNVPVAGSSQYTGASQATFTLSETTAANALFNFNSNNGAGDYSLTGFLTSGGDTLNYLTGGNQASIDSPNGCLGAACVTDDLFQFTGSTTLAVGTYTFMHDDGLLLYLSGVANPVINQPGPTTAEATNFNVCAVAGPGCDAVAGTYSFVLDYAEVDGAPAVLTTNLPLTGPPPSTVTPEPSSLILLGTGLMGAAGMFYRRRLTA